MKSTIRIFSLGTILTACFVLVGCGSRPAVEGKISVRGKLLNSGTVTFRSGDVVRGATIQRDGSFAVTDCPPGRYQVTVDVPNRQFARNARAVPKAAEMPGKPAVDPEPTGVVPVVVDSKYRDPNLSGLTYTVSAEIRNLDIELK